MFTFFERPCLYAGNLLFFSLLIFDADGKQSILWKRSFVLVALMSSMHDSLIFRGAN